MDTKIAELTATIAERDATIAERDDAIASYKRIMDRTATSFHIYAEKIHKAEQATEAANAEVKRLSDWIKAVLKATNVEDGTVQITDATLSNLNTRINELSAVEADRDSLKRILERYFEHKFSV